MIVQGQITFRAGGSRARLHKFSIQGCGIWLPSFKHKVNNREMEMWNAAELEELKECLRADLATFTAG